MARSVKFILIFIVFCSAAAMSADAEKPAAEVPQWKNGLPTSPDFFPIAVWLQVPQYAKKYKEAGFNLYIGQWKGPTEEQLAALKAADMPLICDQNAVGLKHKEDKTIVAWMHGDEPDNAQALPDGKKGYGPPILPQKIIDDYKRIHEADPTRPVLLGLGQGVAFDEWIGRGTRTNKPEDYPEYIKGCDMVSFDIYPAVHKNKAVAGNLWFVPQGVDRLRKWSNNEKPVWCCIECTHIENPDKMPSPHDVRSEVWMALIHGARGIIYFVHEFKPKFIEAGLFAHPEMLQAVTELNHQITELAPILNSPILKDGVSVKALSSDVPVDVMTKHHDKATYVFAVAMRNTETKAVFTLAGSKGPLKAEVLGEKRMLDVKDGQFEDNFAGYDVHLYKIVDGK